MYIIELITKLIKERKERKKTAKTFEDNESEMCEHIFLPIDSTEEILACSKCGQIIKKENIKTKPKNPFV